MPTTIGFSFGDVVLVPFPFTDQTAYKKRPAVIVSSTAYHRLRADVVVMAVTSRQSPSIAAGEVAIVRWQQAGLLKPSIFKPVLATVDGAIILRRLGGLQGPDRDAPRGVLQQIFG